MPTQNVLARSALAAGFSLATVCVAAQPAPSADASTRAVMLMPAPPVQRYRARDGAQLAFREFEPASRAAQPPVVAIVFHGSAGDSRNLTVLGQALAAAGVPTFTPDARGQGLSGRRGDIDYIGQLDDDLADVIGVVRRRYPDARLVLAGHSSGGGFVLRVAGEPLGRQFSRFVLIAPYLGIHSPSTNQASGWSRPDLPRIIALAALNQVGVTQFNGLTTIRFNVPARAVRELGVTPAWSYRMMDNFGPRGQLQLGGEPAYLADAAHAAAPIVVVAGAADEQMNATRYGDAFRGLAHPPAIELAPGVRHMEVLSDPRSVPLIVAAIKGRG
ncbi:MAG TPA: alpha/beta fold hydrolase [Caulobacteraceae bacterium]|jgi:alpha-beta hydrolase superfamily lysophospholipase|nr:alpha/beta fold hydrolase [Caulobacteraceae bacterium]